MSSICKPLGLRPANRSGCFCANPVVASLAGRTAGPGVAPAICAISSYQPTCATGGHGRRLMEAVEAEARLRRCGARQVADCGPRYSTGSISSGPLFCGLPSFRSTGQTRSVRAGDGCSNVTGLQMPTRQRLFSGNFSLFRPVKGSQCLCPSRVLAISNCRHPPLNHHYPASYHRRSIFLHRYVKHMTDLLHP